MILEASTIDYWMLLSHGLSIDVMQLDIDPFWES